MKYRTILLFGAPGAGKGTQGKILGAIPRFFHCACGDVFRSLKPDSAAGKLFHQYSSRGQLVPDEATVQIWRYFIEARTASGLLHPEEDTLVLDGIPRNIRQAQILTDQLEVVLMLYLRCPDEAELVRRLQGRASKENRSDDASAEVIRERLKTYERETKPLLDFYGKKLLRRIDATQTPQKVALEVLRELVKV